MFSPDYIKNITRNYNPGRDKIETITAWQDFIKEINKMPKIRRPSEKKLHGQFFRDVFVKALGYKEKEAASADFTIEEEYITDVDKTRPDGVLGFLQNDSKNNDVQVVIELKSPGTDLNLRQNRGRDRRTPVDQAFSYAHKYDNVKWVIVTNYDEFRLYNSQTSKEAQTFFLSEITDDEEKLKLFFKLLVKENLISEKGNSKTTETYLDKEEERKKITKEFYEKYKDTRLATARHILEQSSEKDSDKDKAVEKAVSIAQTIMDRILFIAFLEDLNQGLVPKEVIQKAYEEDSQFSHQTTWEKFQVLFEAMNSGSAKLKIPEYNGGLFEKNPDIDALKISNEVLEKYAELAEYDFSSELSVNILGTVFEWSIDDLDILKAELKNKKVKSDRRHKTGSYYTPPLVADYIVKKTLDLYFEDVRTELGFYKLPELKDEWLGDDKNKSRKAHIEFWRNYAEKLRTIKIVDPSCGSGAFLVAAFDYLKKEAENINDELKNLKSPSFFDKIEPNLLKNNLFGVDISEESIEITRLSLWLKIASKGEKLVALDKNIIIADAVAGKEWRDLFPEVMAEGGFDIVIGNPPYLRQEGIKDDKPILKERSSFYTGKTDLYVYFYELGYNILKENGYLGYITSNKWLRVEYGEKLREFIKSKVAVNTLIDLKDKKLFDGAITYTNIIIFKKQLPSNDNGFIISESPFFDDRKILTRSYLRKGIYLLENDPLFWSAREKLENIGTPIGEWDDIKIIRGITSGLNKAFYIDVETKEKIIKNDPKSADIIKHLLRGENVRKWHVAWEKKWLVLTRRGFDIDSCPSIKDHLSAYKKRLEARKGSQSWYELQSGAVNTDFEIPKILAPTIRNGQAFILDKDGYFVNDKANIISGTNLAYISAVLNSDLMHWYLFNTGPILRGGYLELKIYVLKKAPIPQIPKIKQKPFIELSDKLHKFAKERHGISQAFLELLQADFEIKKLGEKLENWSKLDFAGFLKALKSKRIKVSLQQKDEWQAKFMEKQAQVKALDEQIMQSEQKLNELVYDLYGLTKEEIAFVNKDLH